MVAYPRTALAVLCVASFLAVADTTVVTIALPSIRQALGFAPGDAQWVLNAYALAFGGLLLLFGLLADRLGRRRSFIAGVVVFAAGSAVAGLATGAWLLLAGRILQGVGAAAFVPTSLALLTVTFTDPRARSRALAVYGAMAGLGFVAGMVGGGVIAELWGWRWIFLVNLPITALTLMPAHRVLPESRTPAAGGRLDAGGAVAVTAGLTLVIYAITAGSRAGWRAPEVVVAGALGILGLAAFVMVERRHPDPLVPPALVAGRAVTASNGAIALQSMVGVAWLYLLTLYFQDVLGHGALVSGLLFAPMTVASVVGATLAGGLAVRLGARATAASGIAVVIAGLAAMAVGVTAPHALGWMVTGMVVGEIGFMLGSVALTIAATGSLADDHAGLAAGLLNTSTQLGGGAGLGIVAAVVTATAHGDLSTGALRAGFITCIVFSALAVALVLGGLRAPSRPGPGSRRAAAPSGPARPLP
jgi:EmrB/QacA subfamily drug resistance transporter